jgi:hypothetical protein
MRARGLSPLFVLTLLLAACGGSGSSGFDVAPGIEAPLIDRAIAENRCVEGDGGLLICPSGVPAPGPDGGMNAPGPSDVRVAANLAGAVDCATDDACTLPVDVSADGLPEGARVRVATRASGADSWRIGAPVEVQPSVGGDPVVTPVEVQLDGGLTQGSEVQVAVLVFLPPLGAVPDRVRELRDTGASYAFVLPPIALIPDASS